MGKVRTAVLGSEEEQQQKQKAEARREAKKAAKSAEKTQTHGAKSSDKTQIELSKSENQKSGKSESQKRRVPSESNLKKRSPRYSASVKTVEKNKIYSLKEALALLTNMEKAKFDETVELHLNTTDKVSLTMSLPHGTGKTTKVAVLNPTKDAAGADKLLKAIESGVIDFDILVATPDAMPKLARVARVLGPKGLMPNPKNGTVTPNPDAVAKKFEAGQVNFKTEAKTNILHATLGKVGFGKEKLTDNIEAFLASIDAGKVKSVYLKATMSPSIRIK